MIENSFNLVCENLTITASNCLNPKLSFLTHFSCESSSVKAKNKKGNSSSKSL